MAGDQEVDGGENGGAPSRVCGLPDLSKLFRKKGADDEDDDESDDEFDDAQGSGDEDGEDAVPAVADDDVDFGGRFPCWPWTAQFRKSGAGAWLPSGAAAASRF